MKKKENHENKRLSQSIKSKTSIALIISLFFHCLFVIGTYIMPKVQPYVDKEAIEVSINEAALEYLKPTEDPKKIVEFDKKNDDQKADDKAKYYAAKNNSVQKETLAKLSDQFKNVEKSKSTVIQKAETQAENQWEKKVDHSAKAKLFNTGFDVYEKMHEKDVARQKRANASASTQDASTATDKIEGVDQSLMTQLNTKEYKYYGYYTRIRHQLNQWWQPKVKEKVSKLMSKGRTIAAEQNKNTKVIIVLNDQGTLVKVQILGASGVRELDDAAVEAFKQAAPFPNPPKGLVDTDGTIKIRWDFIVES